MLSQPDPDDDGAPARRLRQDEGDAEVIGQRIGDVGGDLGDVGLDPFGVLEVVVVGEFDQHAGRARLGDLAEPGWSGPS